MVDYVKYQINVMPELDDKIEKAMKLDSYHYKSVFVREAIREKVQRILAENQDVE